LTSIIDRTRTERVMLAAQRLTSEWAGYAASDNACHMTRTEAEAMADLFVACGESEAATVLLEAWIDSEIDDGEAERDDWTVENHGLGPVLVDNVRMTCETCGRIGTRDDAIWIDGPCQEPCDGTIIRYEEEP
jgi:hypothetical protein